MEILRNPFDGEDVVEAVNNPTVLENLRMVFGSLIAEGFVTEMVADSSFREERTGIEGFLEAWRDWADPFSSMRIEVEEVREVGDNIWTPVVLVGVPKEGTTEISQRAAAVWTMDGGKLARVEFHLDPETGERAAGLGG
jgi:ketosteroid isomerase-like protein